LLIINSSSLFQIQLVPYLFFQIIARLPKTHNMKCFCAISSSFIALLLVFALSSDIVDAYYPYYSSMYSMYSPYSMYGMGGMGGMYGGMGGMGGMYGGMGGMYGGMGKPKKKLNHE
jgi:hypothetical protein